MTLGGSPDRDAAQVDALVADRYLDALLAAGDRRAADAPADAALDPELRHAARVLRASLVRVHPSFRFEERLAARLADLASARGRSVVAVDGGVVVPFRGALVGAGAGTRGARGAPDDTAADPLLDAILRGDLDPTDEAALAGASGQGPDRRPFIVGGAAITSAAISIVGVAYVAWRASRPAGHAGAGGLGRAARTAHARRAAIAGLGLGGPA